MKVNLNQHGTVKLTSTGRAALAKYNSQFRNDHLKLRPNEDGTLRLPLWELMSIFGSCIRLGAESPFFLSEIDLPER